MGWVSARGPLGLVTVPGSISGLSFIRWRSKTAYDLAYMSRSGRQVWSGSSGVGIFCTPSARQFARGYEAVANSILSRPSARARARRPCKPGMGLLEGPEVPYLLF